MPPTTKREGLGLRMHGSVAAFRQDSDHLRFVDESPPGVAVAAHIDALRQGLGRWADPFAQVPRGIDDEGWLGDRLQGDRSGIDQLLEHDFALRQPDDPVGADA
jgi:hypothetical protein